jgi:hypothetical protein
MITIPLHTDPPRWMEAAVSSLLPPACREVVLGDLQERFGERGARARWVGYVGDAVTTVPQVLRSQMRRSVTRGSACAAAVPGDLRSRAEHLQTQVWIRNVAMLVSILLVIGSFLLNARGAWHFNESVILAMTIGWIGATWRSYAVRGRSTFVPASLSWNELRAFHRRELRRQMDLQWREFVYWSVPAVLLILYGLAVAVPGFRGGVMMLGALAMQNCVIAWAHRYERSRYQRELDRLDQEVEQA